MSVLEAVEVELAQLRVHGALAAVARAMAEQLDGSAGATAKSMCARVLLDTMDRLRAVAPAEDQGDRVDEIALYGSGASGL